MSNMNMKKLGDIAEVFSGVQVSRYIDDTADLYPVIKNKFRYDNILDYSNEKVSQDINSKYFSKKGDIIISLSQPNTVSILEKNGFIIPMYFAVIRVKEGYNSSFIYHLLNSNLFHEKSYRFLEGGSLRVIKISDLRDIKINIPDIDEQNKYAEFFNLIDQKNKILESKKNCNNKLKEYLIQTELRGVK